MNQQSNEIMYRHNNNNRKDRHYINNHDRIHSTHSSHTSYTSHSNDGINNTYSSHSIYKANLIDDDQMSMLWIDLRADALLLGCHQSLLAVMPYDHWTRQFLQSIDCLDIPPILNSMIMASQVDSQTQANAYSKTDLRTQASNRHPSSFGTFTPFRKGQLSMEIRLNPTLLSGDPLSSPSIQSSSRTSIMPK